MRVLLDGNVPRAFGTLLPGHRVDTVHQRRWSDLDDGPLLDAADAQYDAFITMDQSLRFQQNLRGRRLRILLIRAPRNTLPVLAPLAQRVIEALSAMQPGEFRMVGHP
jgi:predicted nuclease of predicted toxin-antitoxin system